MRFFLPMLCALTACNRAPTGLEQHLVREAWLGDVDLTTVVLLGGGITGSADLHIIDDYGQEWMYPVHLGGATFGLAFDVGVSPLANHLELDLPRTLVPGNDLLGRYRGAGFSLVLGLGADIHHLKNKSDVRLGRTLFAAGIGIFVGTEGLTIKLSDEDPDEDPDETGPDTGDTSDTGVF